MMRVKIYKTYRFSNQDPAISDLKKVLRTRNESVEQISRNCGVTSKTIHNWVNGKTKRPQHATLEAVARAVGYSFKFNRK